MITTAVSCSGGCKLPSDSPRAAALAISSGSDVLDVSPLNSAWKKIKLFCAAYISFLTVPAVEKHRADDDDEEDGRTDIPRHNSVCVIHAILQDGPVGHPVNIHLVVVP